MAKSGEAFLVVSVFGRGDGCRSPGADSRRAGRHHGSLGLVSAETLSSLVSHPLTKLYLLGPLLIDFFPTACTVSAIPLYDTGLRGYQTPIAVICYGAAIIGTVATIFVLVSI